MRRFHLDVSPEVGEVVDLPPDTAHHIQHVLRLKHGNEVIIFNGKGQEYIAKLLLADNKPRIEIKNTKLLNKQREIELILVQALVSSAKFDTIIQKSTELGVNRIIPLICQRSLPMLKKNIVEKKMNRWQKIITEAARQSERVTIPHISPPQKWREIFTGFNLPTTLKLIAYAREPLNNLKKVLRSASQYDKIVITIGPEGGFSPEEITETQDNGFIPVSIADWILRTETAGLSAISALNYHLMGD